FRPRACAPRSRASVRAPSPPACSRASSPTPKPPSPTAHPTAPAPRGLQSPIVHPRTSAVPCVLPTPASCLPPAHDNASLTSNILVPRL
ncbi:Unknown protein, partial [Striga hermonthica]